ncbi:TM0106 family RecB-like putative nuclease [Granulicoccus sp. GXG6511]|uniref:TM0106 family RecB-like putative nuclease n=1 Tax=Granulicoccus sp. GXG6511 TaxID=3381351 RepID=UPI003D7CA940
MPPPPHTPVPPGEPKPIVLDAYAARTCVIKTWNKFAPDVEPPAPDEGLRESFAGGIGFTDHVLTELLHRFPGPVADLRPLADAPWDEQEYACAQAVRHGVPVIIGGLLPLDVPGARSGRPDLLVRGDDRPDGRTGYHPVVIARRQTAEKRPSTRTAHTVRASALATPAYRQATTVRDRSLRTQNDAALLQSAHYWRQLDATGHSAPGPATAGVLGTDAYPELDGAAITWVNLTDPLVRTFSRSAPEGWRLRSVLERYDHEHGFRVRVATAARAGEPPMVTPIRNRECDACHWWEVCAPQLGADDLSVRIDKTPLDVREIQALRVLGVRTVTDLAEVDLAALKERYLPEVRHRQGAEQRLELAARRARLMVSEVELERLTACAIDVPTADLEIDFDIESSADERVYLWGFLVHDRRRADPPAYVEFSAWSDLSKEAEIELARRAMTWLRALVAGPASVRVYHYSTYEVVRLANLASAADDPTLEWAIDYAEREFCDLFEVVRDHFFGVRGLGLKVVASVGAGFAWRDVDAGGLNSQAWFDEACHAAEPAVRAAARERVLAYNEDDVRATHELRAWLRRL